jgi:phage-related baseplate assembly protein
MAGFTAVDLSQLPAPTVVETLSFEAIFAERLAQYIALTEAAGETYTALVESDPIYLLLQESAYREVVWRQRVNDAARAVMVAYAVKADLDQLAAGFGVGRLQLDPGDPEHSIPPTMESDTDLRRRIILAPEGFSVAGPEGAYIFHALSASGDVLDASATSPAPCEVIVSVLSRVGDGTADAALVAAVDAVLNAETVRPLTDFVTVQSAEIIPYTVEATIYTYAGPDSAVVLAASRARLDAYIEESHRIGRDVTMSGLYSVLHSPGVQRVELIAPTADVVVDRTQAAYCTGVTITSGGVDE